MPSEGKDGTAPETAQLIYDGKTYTLPVIHGTEGETAVDITRLRGESGLITLDSGFANTGAPVMYATPFILTLLALGLGMHFLPPNSLERLAGGFCRLPVLLQGALVGFGIVAIDALGPAGVAPFIYFQFCHRR